MNVTDYLTSWSASYRHDFTENIMPFCVNILLHTRMEKNCTFGFAGCVVFRIDYGANET